MIVFSDLQLEAFRDDRLSLFSRELLTLCRTRISITAELSDEQLLVAIERALKKSSDLGFKLRGGQRLFVELALTFGCDFDLDPLHNWAHRAIDVPSVVTEKRRARKLHEAMVEFIEGTCSAEDRQPALAMRAFRHLMSKADYGLPDDNRSDAMAELLAQQFPERMRFATEGGFLDIMAAATTLAAKHDFASPNDIPFLGLMMTAYGISCFQDPALPWIAAAFDEGGLFLVRETAYERMATPPSRRVT